MTTFFGYSKEEGSFRTKIDLRSELPLSLFHFFCSFGRARRISAQNVKEGISGHGAVFCPYEKEQPLTWSLVNLAPVLTRNKIRNYSSAYSV